MRVFAILVTLLLFAPASALASKGPDFSFSPSAPTVGQVVTFVADDCDADEEYRWSFGEGPDAAGCRVTHTFSAARTFSVTLVVTDDDDREERIRPVTVHAAPPASSAPSPQPGAPSIQPGASSTPPANRAPAVGFTVSTTGLAASFAAISVDAEGDELSHRWDFGDGTTSASMSPTHIFKRSGTYLVRLTVTEASGGASTAQQTITVIDGTTTSVTAGSTGPPAASDSLSAGVGRLTPFPLVRIAGQLIGRRTLVRLLTVRAGRGTQVTVTCRGAGCPVRRLRMTLTRDRPVSVRRFERRRLSQGASLTVRVTRPGHIGKYTRFTFRARRGPTRTDQCLAPGSTRPVACT